MSDSSFFRFLIVSLCLAVLIAGPVAASSEDGVSPDARSTSSTEGTAANEGSAAISSIMARARKAGSLGYLAVAEELYQNVLVRESANLDAMLELASIYEQMGKLQYARGLLLRAAALDAYNETIIKRSVAVTSKLSASLHREVDSLITTGHCDLAIPKLSILLTLEPENPELYYFRAFCHYKLGRPEAALAEIEKALRLRSDKAFHELHEIIHQRLDELEVQTLIQKAKVLTNPAFPKAKPEALEVLGKILELDPDNSWAKQEFIRLSDGDAVSALPEETGRIPGHGGFFTRIADFGKYAGNFRTWGMNTLKMISKNIEFILAILLLILIFHSPLIQALLKGVPPRSLLSGRLSQFSIHEILTLINSQAQSGILNVRGKSLKADIFFENGEAYHCVAGNLKGKEALKYTLDHAKEGHFHFKKTTPAIQRTIDTPFSLIIMDLPNRKQQGSTAKAVKTKKSKIAELLDSRSQSD